MILYEWVYNNGELAEGLFCSEKCTEDTYGDYTGAPSALGEQESKELVRIGGWEVCSGCRKPLNDPHIPKGQPLCCDEAVEEWKATKAE